MADPAGWLLSQLRELSTHFGWAYSYRGSIFLIAGGVFVLGVLTLVLLVQSTLFGAPVRREAPPAPSVLVRAPAPPPPLDPESAKRLAEQAATSPDDVFRLGARAGAAMPAKSLDVVLDRFVQAGLGDPRIVSTSSHRKRVRVAACRTCSAFEATGARTRTVFAWDPSQLESRVDARVPCEYERGFLEGAFRRLTAGRARVAETHCRNRGDAACIYEVVY